MDVFFHIGKIKTGTTSIQNFLAGNADALKKYHLYYGEYVTDWGGVPPAHFNFFYATLKDVLIDLGYAKLAAGRYPKPQSLEALLGETMRKASLAGCQKIIISCENYSQVISFVSNTLKESNIQIDIEKTRNSVTNVFKRAIDKLNINLYFIIYLRNQTGLFASSYNQAVKGGHFFGSADSFCLDQLGSSENDDLSNILHLESIVKKENILVQKFEKSAAKGNLIFNFLSLLSDEINMSDFIVKKDSNVSLSYEIIEFRKFLGANLPKKNKNGIFYEFIFEEFQRQQETYRTKIPLSPDTKSKVQAYYSEMNQRIAERYFSDNPEVTAAYSDKTPEKNDALKPLGIQALSKLTCAFINFLDERNIATPCEDNKKMATVPPQTQAPKASGPPKFSRQDIENGAPYGPLPKSFYVVDPRLEICQALIEPEERDTALKSRVEFLREGNTANPYFDDKARAFRLLQGKSYYLEVGTFDRGNLAYVSTFLADNAVLIGVDIAADERGDALLHTKLKPGQTYISIKGDSRDPNTFKAVQDALQGKILDAVFIDANHTAYSVMSDYANCEPLVADDGVFLFHDSVWEGNDKYKGVADALDEISKVEPVYLIDGRNPCRVFSRPLWRAEFWGCVGVIFASDQKWRGNAR